MIRPSTVGLAGSGFLLVVDVAWLAVVRPPSPEPLIAWFGALVVVGAFLPGLANQVTMARAHLAAPALVYSLIPSKPIPLATVVGLAGLSDLLDGAVARGEGPSRLGGALDPVVDGLFFGAVAIGLAAGGAYPGWLAAVVVARYALPALVGGVLLVVGRRPRLRHTPMGQASTTLIAFLLGALALLRGVGLEVGPLLVLSEAAIPLAALAALGNLFWDNRAAILDRRP